MNNLSKSDLAVLVSNGCKDIFEPRKQNKAGLYVIQTVKDQKFTVLVKPEGEAKYKAINPEEVETISDAKILCLTDSLNVATKETINHSCTLSFKDIKPNVSLLMTVNDKGYNTIDLTPLTPAKVKQILSDVVE